MEINRAFITLKRDCWSTATSSKYPNVKMTIYGSSKERQGVLLNVCYVFGKDKQIIDKFLKACKRHEDVKAVNCEFLNSNCAKIRIIVDYQKSVYKILEDCNCFRKSWQVKNGLEGGIIVSKNADALNNSISKLRRLGKVKLMRRDSIKINTSFHEYLNPHGYFLKDFLISLTPKYWRKN